MEYMCRNSKYSDNKICHFFGFLLILFLGQFSSAEHFKDDKVVQIPIYMSFSASSVWTREEILERFNYNRNMLLKLCNIELTLGGLVEIKDPSLQDIQGYRTDYSLSQVKRIQSYFPNSARPLVMYVRAATPEGSGELSQFLAQASMLGEPFHPDIKSAVPGNIFPETFLREGFLHGTVVIAQENSANSPASLHIDFGRDTYGLEIHELGHVFLNDAGHNDMDGNYMSYVKHADAFTDKQCERMRAYPVREVTVFEDYKSEFNKLYEYYLKKDPDSVKNIQKLD